MSPHITIGESARVPSAEIVYLQTCWPKQQRRGCCLSGHCLEGHCLKAGCRPAQSQSGSGISQLAAAERGLHAPAGKQIQPVTHGDTLTPDVLLCQALQLMKLQQTAKPSVTAASPYALKLWNVVRGGTCCDAHIVAGAPDVAGAAGSPAWGWRIPVHAAVGLLGSVQGHGRVDGCCQGLLSGRHGGRL